MKNKLKGIIYYSKIIKDNDLFIKVLSSNDEINSGMVYGGYSSKKKLIYQNGYFIEYSITKKNQNFPSVFQSEISKPFIGNIYNDKYKMHALLSILGLINLSIVEGQHIKGFFNDVESLINIIVNNNRWINIYCEWLFTLLKKIGYQIDYKKNINLNYYDIINQEFTNTLKENCVNFPHKLFSTEREINLKNISTIFIIFESIFLQNHLDNIRYKMPMSFLNFKNIITKKLQS